MKESQEKTLERDPVCGMNVEAGKAAAKVEYLGKTYYFCASSCAKRFQQAPEKYVGNLEKRIAPTGLVNLQSAAPSVKTGTAVARAPEGSEHSAHQDSFSRKSRPIRNTSRCVCVSGSAQRFPCPCWCLRCLANRLGCISRPLFFTGLNSGWLLRWCCGAVGHFFSDFGIRCLIARRICLR